MSLFTKKTKIKDPYAGDKRKGLDFLTGLMQGGTPDIPTRGIADLTDTQRRIQAGVGDQFSDLNENYGTARDYLTEVVGGGYDPRTSDYYKGLRQEGEDFKADARTDIRQSANLGGMLQSTPRMAVESEMTRKTDRDTLTRLGSMYETERGRMGQAAEGLGRLDANRVAMTSNLQAIADLERRIEQDRNDAVYNQAMQTITFPYQYQAQLANSLIGASDPYMTGGGPKGWVTDTAGIMKLGAAAAGMPGGGMPMPSGGGNAANTGRSSDPGYNSGGPLAGQY
jgi:hypothetical protein